MTREEAIVYFEDAKEYCESVSISTKTTHISAYELAIEALKQIKAIEDIINVSNLTIQEDVLKYKMIVDIVKGER